MSKKKKGQVKTGGGVCTYIRNDIPHDAYSLSNLNRSDEHIEVQIVVICKPNMKKIIFMNVYRPPDGNTDTFTDALKDILGNIPNREKYEIIVTGDMNIDILTKEAIYNKLRDTLNPFKLRQLIFEPTRFPPNNKGKNSILDLIFTNIDCVSASGTVDILITDHIPVYMTRKIVKEKVEKIVVTGRTYLKLTDIIISGWLRDYDWSVFDSCADVEKCWDLYEGALRAMLDRYCPVKTFHIPKYQDPWMSIDVVEQLRDKNLKFSKAKKSPKQKNMDDAKKLKNKSNKLNDKARRAYIKDTLEENKDNHKRFWRIINNILPGQTNSKPIIHLIDDSDNTPVPSEQTADFINEYFTKIGPNLATDMNTPWQPYDDECPNQIELFETNIQEVQKLVHDININKSSAIEGIATRVLKKAFQFSLDKITKIFNLSFSQGKVPTMWKKSQVTPIPKSGNLRSVNNYRPISLLPLPCKLIERIVHNRVYGFLEKEKILTKKQGGFRPGHSTVDTLCKFTDELLRNNNVAIDTVAVFIDLRKAFDTVDHRILLDKLERYGIRLANLRWFFSYLSNRTQVVNANGVTSSMLPVVCGVPQGSILGPLLFLLYVNDMTCSVKDCSVRLYADDTVIYKATPSRGDTIKAIQTDLENYQTWCVQNKLSINIIKTKVMIFTASRIHPNTNDINLLMDDVKLHVVDTYKYLGVILDTNLTFERHINSVHQVVCYKTYQLACLRIFLTVKIALLVYRTTILPYFDYADIVFMNAQQNHIKKLQTDQNRCLKICLKVDHRTNTMLIHQETCMPMLSDRRHTHLLNYMYTRSRDVDYVDHRSLITRAHTGPTVKITRSNCASYDRSVEYFGAISWNALPPNRRNLETLSLFKADSKIKLRDLIPKLEG